MSLLQDINRYVKAKVERSVITSKQLLLGKHNRVQVPLAPSPNSPPNSTFNESYDGYNSINKVSSFLKRLDNVILQFPIARTSELPANLVSLNL